MSRPVRVLTWMTAALVLAVVATTAAALLANRALSTAEPGLAARLWTHLAYNVATVAPDSRFPELEAPRYAARPRDALLAAAEVLRQLGFEQVAVDAEARIVTAVAVTPLLRFRDDIEVRVQPDEGGSRLTARSASRVGRGDLGANRNHLRRLLEALETRLPTLPASA